MAKKSGFFSWFKKDKTEAKKQELETAPQEQEESLQVQPEEQNVEQDDSTLVTMNDVEQTAQVDEAIETQFESDEAQALQDQQDENKTESEITEAVEIETNDVSDGETAPVAESEDTKEPQAEETPLVDNAESDAEPEVVQPESVEVVEKEEKLGFFERLKRGLSKTRQQIGGGFLSLFKGKQIDDDLYEELETQLLMADVGMDTTMKLIERLTDHADRKQLKDADALYGLLKEEMSDILKKADAPLAVDKADGPFVILMVGVNGVGKTTTIGKMAKQFQQQGKSVMLAAGDTFRAAAVEQLQVWGERNDVPVVAQHTGADSASVIFDAYQAAKARNADILIADTAGRLQNKDNLMQELEKIVRVLKKFDANIPHEIMLTIDATTGQNAISQTKIFNEAVGLTGISLTKLDGTAKGGVIFAVAEQFGIPIRYIGVGEGIEDLRTFEHKSFIDALFDEAN